MPRNAPLRYLGDNRGYCEPRDRLTERVADVLSDRASRSGRSLCGPSLGLAESRVRVFVPGRRHGRPRAKPRDEASLRRPRRAGRPY